MRCPGSGAMQTDRPEAFSYLVLGNLCDALLLRYCFR